MKITLIILISLFLVSNAYAEYRSAELYPNPCEGTYEVNRADDAINDVWAELRASNQERLDRNRWQQERYELRKQNYLLEQKGYYSY